MLSIRELNRALLAPHLLLEPLETATRALERVGGLQSQYAPSAYIAPSGRAYTASAARR